MDYKELAYAIFKHCDMGVTSELPEEEHINSIITALKELNDNMFNIRILNADTDAKYMLIPIPNNEIIAYYMNNGKDNITSGGK